MLHVLGNAGAALHGVGLSGPGLAVGEDADVVAIKGGLNELRNLGIDVTLA